MATFCAHFSDGTYTEVDAPDIVYAVSQLNQVGKRYSIDLIYRANATERVIKVGLELNDRRRRHTEDMR